MSLEVNTGVPKLKHSSVVHGADRILCDEGSVDLKYALQPDGALATVKSDTGPADPVENVS
jgi:hypothetical protein